MELLLAEHTIWREDAFFFQGLESLTVFGSYFIFKIILSLFLFKSRGGDGGSKGDGLVACENWVEMLSCWSLRVRAQTSFAGRDL
jgi:hypothetical protein